jgi:hypothetical protein
VADGSLEAGFKHFGEKPALMRGWNPAFHPKNVAMEGDGKWDSSMNQMGAADRPGPGWIKSWNMPGRY